MIIVTRINGKKFAVNSDLIEFIEETPDTVISLKSGRKIVVDDSLDVLIQRIVEHKRQVFSSIIGKLSQEGE